jgi:hypothetical protein
MAAFLEIFFFAVVGSGAAWILATVSGVSF